MKPLASAVTAARFGGIGLVLAGLALLGVAARSGNIVVSLFYVGGCVILAGGSFAQSRKEALAALEADVPPPTPFRQSSFDVAARAAGGSLAAAAVVLVVGGPFDAWEFAACGLVGFGAGQLVTSEWLRRLERSRGIDLFLGPRAFFRIRTEYRPWRPARWSGPNTTTYFVSARPPRPDRAARQVR